MIDLSLKIVNKIDINKCIEEKKFTHLHVHTYFSFLDGMGSPEEKVIKAKQLGMTSLAITDHNHLGGVPDFVKACKKHGIKPVIGVELYYTHDMSMISAPKEKRDEMALELAKENGVEIPSKAKKSEIKELCEPYQYDTQGYHIILFAKNQTGWKNLVRIQSEAADKGLFNGRYHADNELLKKYSEGIIVTSACIGSMPSSYLREGKYEEAKQVVQSWVDIFGEENVFLEIQGLDWEIQYNVNLQLIEIAKELNLKVIATNDAHYTEKEDFDDHDTLLCIGIGKYKTDENRMKYDHEFWLKDYDEMIHSFNRLGCNDEEYMKEIVIALANTNIIPAMVEDIELGSSVPLFSNIDLPEGETPESVFTRKCWLNLYAYLQKAKLTHKRREYEERLAWELHVINTKGYAPYMLAVEEYVNWANANGCPTGPGRGSAAGSLALFVTGITRIIDPIKYNLLFSRFLTMDRTALPDVDIDFEYFGRDSVIKHLEDLYGKDKVCHIGTYTEMGVKSGLKDVGRVLQIPFNIMNEISKTISEITGDAPSISFKDLDALESEDINKFNEFKEIENKYPELFRLARRFEGTKRNAGVHASGVLVTPMPINDLFPTRTVDGVKVTLYPGPLVEELNGVKYDILGLKTLTVIDKTLKSIDENLTWEDLYEAVEVDDEGVFSMLSNKETDAIFQLESDLFKGMIGDMQPTHLNDIIALTALGRPGPLQAGMHTQYNKRKNGLEPIDYLLHNTEDILEANYGCIVYQEDVMLIAKKVAGFDDNQADSYLRKATAKKKIDLMNLCKRWMIYGKVNKPIPEGYDNDNPNCVMYDPTGKYGAEILGGSNNGYSVEDLTVYWNTIEGFCSYLFNKSHAACYGYISLLCGYLKKYYPVEFMAAVLTMEGNETKKAKYLTVCEKNMGIKIDVPNVNFSKRDFTPLANESKILYGLGSIKGVGDSSIDPIIEHAPYNTLTEMLEKLSKKVLNKRVGLALIKSGALKHIEENRNVLINEFYELRKDKDDRAAEGDWDEKICIEYEKETLGAPITYKPFYDAIPEDTTVEISDLKLISRREKIDKKGNMMSFVNLQKDGISINGVVFASTYARTSNHFDPDFVSEISVRGKKDSKGSFIISSVICSKQKTHEIDSLLDELI